MALCTGTCSRKPQVLLPLDTSMWLLDTLPRAAPHPPSLRSSCPVECLLLSPGRSVHAHNRRADEEEMWELYQQQRERKEAEAQRRQQCGRSGRSTDRSRSRSRDSGSGDRSRGLRRSGSRSRSRSREADRGTSLSRSRSGSDERQQQRRRQQPAQDAAAGQGEEEEEELSDEGIAAMIAAKRSRWGGGAGLRPGACIVAGSLPPVALAVPSMVALQVCTVQCSLGWCLCQCAAQ